MAQENHTAKLQKLKHYIESLCGIYSRIARRLGVDRTYVSRVAKGERRSPEVEEALVREFDRTQKKGRLLFPQTKLTSPLFNQNFPKRAGESLSVGANGKFPP